MPLLANSIFSKTPCEATFFKSVKAIISRNHIFSKSKFEYYVPRFVCRIFSLNSDVFGVKGTRRRRVVGSADDSAGVAENR